MLLLLTKEGTWTLAHMVEGLWGSLSLSYLLHPHPLSHCYPCNSNSSRQCMPLGQLALGMDMHCFLLLLHHHHPLPPCIREEGVVMGPSLQGGMVLPLPSPFMEPDKPVMEQGETWGEDISNSPRLPLLIRPLSLACLPHRPHPEAKDCHRPLGPQGLVRHPLDP